MNGEDNELHQPKCNGCLGEIFVDVDIRVVLGSIIVIGFLR